MKTKHWYESKAIWLGIITTVIGIFTMLAQQYPDVGVWMTTVGVLNIMLRSLTTTVIK